MTDEHGNDLPQASQIAKRKSVRLVTLICGNALVLVVSAVFFGVGLSQKDEARRLLAERQPVTEEVPVVVAKKQLYRGDQIVRPETMFEVKQFIKGNEPILAITEIDSLKGMQLKRPLRAGDFVTPDDLRDETAANWPTQRPVGSLAYPIRVDESAFGGKFAELPNTRVDIILTTRRKDDCEPKARILLENVLVLDAYTHHDDCSRAVADHVVTFSLFPEDVLKLELAVAIGTIRLVRRK